MGYALDSSVIVGSGIWLPPLGVERARIMGWSNSFVGTLFVAMATSVPELATTIAALRIGAVEVAIGRQPTSQESWIKMAVKSPCPLQQEHHSRDHGR